MALTYKQFNAKMSNNKKYAALSPAQKRKAYQVYALKQTKGPQPGKKASGAPKSKAVGQMLGSAAGAFLPGPLKMLAPLAGELGGWAGEKLGTILGLGEYQVKQNSIIGEGTTPPMMHNSSDRVIIRHREYLGDVFSSATPGAFSVSNYALQPGVSHSFPWMSQIAQAFTEWEPHGIVFEFKSNTGFVSGASTPAVGMVIMATDYDSYNTDPFKNKVDMENTVYTTSAKSTESFYHPVECARNRNVFERLFVRHDVVPENQPPQLYDMGTFAIASVGQPVANQNLGELWITYEISLSKATMRNFQTTIIDTDYFYANVNTHPSKSLFAYFVPGEHNSIGATVSGTDTSAVYTFPPKLSAGTYQFTLNMWSTTVVTWTVATGLIGTYVNCVNESVKMGGYTYGPPGPFSDPSVTGFQGAPSLSVNATLASLTWRVRVTGPGARVTLGTGALVWAATMSGGALLVSKVNDNTTSYLPPLTRSPALFGPPRLTESERRALIHSRTAVPQVRPPATSVDEAIGEPTRSEPTYEELRDLLAAAQAAASETGGFG